ncbi:MAG: 5-methyltetrahydropteroyltriglutamate--homocysteine S-methyltransferase, partial [Rhodospirillaceae bacterium]|nr:5-methyltetrahydropteroyltriglutamate--homocysteine S-methyltransferase [Rhodospirillaceae bacterium]
MAARTKPPFRADQVGSLLRPDSLHEARAKAAKGEISAEALRQEEDRCINEVVTLQQDIGLQGITDGEFRRTWWHFDFLSGFDGFELGEPLDKGTFQGSDEQPPRAMINGKLARSKPVMVDHFAYLNSQTERVAKFTVPGPSMAHFRAGREGISEDVYPDLAEFWSDLTACYRAELADLAGNGCRYLQLDDISYAYLCDDDIRANLKSRGDDADDLALTYAQALNDAIRDLPGDVTTAMHMCRGNFQSTWAAQGGYEPVAERVFNTVNINALFMEYDSERAGGFEPLRFVPDDKFVVLGLVTTKTPQLESKDTL